MANVDFKMVCCEEFNMIDPFLWSLFLCLRKWPVGLALGFILFCCYGNWWSMWVSYPHGEGYRTQETKCRSREDLRMNTMEIHRHLRGDFGFPQAVATSVGGISPKVWRRPYTQMRLCYFFPPKTAFSVHLMSLICKSPITQLAQSLYNPENRLWLAQTEPI